MKEAILKTLHYADIFDYPLRLEELHKFLIAKNVTIGELRTPLNELIEVGFISAKDDYLFLPGRTELVEVRKQRKRFSRDKLERARKLASLFKILPWVQLVGVTGTLAMENCDDDDDIDLMFITSPRRLWLCRGVIVTFLRFFGLYRRPNKIKDRVCPNIWLSSKELRIGEQDLFVAHEIAQLKPIWYRNKLYHRFVAENVWVRDYLPNWEEADVVEDTRNIRFSFPQFFKRVYETLFDWLDDIFYKMQLRYMRGKITRETVEKDRILFHPLDIKGPILNKFGKKVKSLRGLTQEMKEEKMQT